MDVTEILHRHGALVLFAVVFAEQVGLPLPALPLLVAAGVLIGTGHVGLLNAMLAAVLATMLADGIWYLAGQWRGRPVLSFLCRIALEPDACVRRTENFFRLHGPRSLVVAKFIPGLSTIAPPLAGIVGLGPIAFLLYDGLGTALWVGAGLGTGYAFGTGAPNIMAAATQMTPLLAIAAAGVTLLYIGLKAWRRYELRRAPRIAAGEVARRMEAGVPLLFVDLRPLEHQKEVPGIQGAMSMSLDDLTRTAISLPRDRDIVFYCACPADASSVQAAKLLREKGFTRVWPLAGGIEAWRAATVKSGEAMGAVQGFTVAA